MFWKKEKPVVTKSEVTQEAPQTEAKAMPAIIAVASGKGGVGKSTLTLNLAIALKEMGAKVGILDADIYGPSQPTLLGQPKGELKTNDQGLIIPNDAHGVKFVSMGLLTDNNTPVVWRAPMAMKMISQFLHQVQWGVLDVLLLDLPPGTGDVQLTLAQQAKITGAVIVTTPQQLALGIAQRGLRMFEQVKVPILGIVENMSGFECGHCNQVTNVFKQGGAEALAKTCSVPFLGRIPLSKEIVESGDMGVPVYYQYPKSKAAQAGFDIAIALRTELMNLSSRGSQSEAPEHAEVLKDGSLFVRWTSSTNGNKDHSNLSAFALRVNCGCASCVDENTGVKLLDPTKIDQKIKLTSFQPMGNYAFLLTFSDGHGSGIYPFKKLKEISGSSVTAPLAASPVIPSGDFVARIQAHLDQEINPAVAAHGGKITALDFKDGTLTIQMSGGCQGCASSAATLKQGVERTVKAAFPEVKVIDDGTDHTAGKNPFYKKQPHNHAHDHHGHSHPH